MTREEAIEILCAYGVPQDVEKFQHALNMAIKALEQEPRWIPVSKRMPEPNIPILTYIDAGVAKTYYLAYWDGVGDEWEEWTGYDLLKDKGYEVLAWMPLPTPYEPQESEV